jgi:polyisoprenoid-binding protein YceI
MGLSVLAVAGASYADAASTRVTGSVEFVAIGKPSAIKINGKGGGLDSKIEINGSSVSGRFEIPLDQIDTGIDMRNQHMKEKYLEIAKYPKAELEMPSLTLPSSPYKEGFTSKRQPSKGMLTLHGVKKPVEGVFDATSSAQKLDGQAEFEVKISDFGIAVPKYLGITVADSVKVKVAFNVVLSSAPETAQK